MLISLLLALRGLVHSRAVLHLEVLAPRHQLQVLQRSRPPQVQLLQAGRASGPRGETTLVMVKPETVMAWHHRGFRFFWTWKSRRRIGRSTVPADLRALIRTMSQVNPRWGAPRIHGELLKLGIDVSQATVAKFGSALRAVWHVGRNSQFMPFAQRAVTSSPAIPYSCQVSRIETGHLID